MLAGAWRCMPYTLLTPAAIIPSISLISQEGTRKGTKDAHLYHVPCTKERGQLAARLRLNLIQLWITELWIALDAESIPVQQDRLDEPRPASMPSTLDATNAKSTSSCTTLRHLAILACQLPQPDPAHNLCLPSCRPFFQRARFRSDDDAVPCESPLNRTSWWSLWSALKAKVKIGPCAAGCARR